MWLLSPAAPGSAAKARSVAVTRADSLIAAKSAPDARLHVKLPVPPVAFSGAVSSARFQ